MEKTIENLNKEIEILNTQISALKAENTFYRKAFTNLKIYMSNPHCILCGGRNLHTTDCPVQQVANLQAKYSFLIDN